MQQNVEGAQPAGVRWTGPEIVLVLLLALLVQSLVYLVLDQLGWFRWFYGGDGLKETMQSGGTKGQLASYRLGLWTGSLSAPLQVAIGVSWLRFSCGATFAEMGLTTRWLGRNVALGLLFAVIFAPGAYGLQALAILGMKALGADEQAHPFTQLGQQSLALVEWVLLIVSAVVLAPLWEEFLYRGIVQPWVMEKQPWGGPIALGVALLATLSARSESLQRAVSSGGRELWIEWIPILSLLVLAVVYFVLARHRPKLAGLFATAVLFAWIHARVWPSPVALVWLALGLGWLRWRGQSLVGSIVLHAVFNAIACQILIVNVLMRS